MASANRLTSCIDARSELTAAELMIRRHRLFSLILLLALCTRFLPLCDPAFAMSAMDEAASPCAMMGQPAKSPPAKPHVKPLCLTGCPIIAVRVSGDGTRSLSNAAHFGFVPFE